VDLVFDFAQAWARVGFSINLLAAPHVGRNMYDSMYAEKRSKIRERDAAVAAFDAMIAKRPLKPPPCKSQPGPVRTAGALAAARDRRLGILDGGT
jgi:hypothetical protein